MFILNGPILYLITENGKGYFCIHNCVWGCMCVGVGVCVGGVGGVEGGMGGCVCVCVWLGGYVCVNVCTWSYWIWLTMTYLNVSDYVPSGLYMGFKDSNLEDNYYVLQELGR